MMEFPSLVISYDIFVNGFDFFDKLKVKQYFEIIDKIVSMIKYKKYFFEYFLLVLRNYFIIFMLIY